MLTADCHNGHVFAVEKTEAYDADVAGTLISDLNETYKLIKKQLDDGEIEGKEAIESIDFAVRMCLNELQGYGVNFYE